MEKTITAAILILLLTTAASAARVGVVIDNGTSVTPKCYEIANGSTANFLCSQPGFGCQNFGAMGFAVCKINNLGCPTTNCFCAPETWSLYTKTNGGWEYSILGISSINASDGMVIGFIWGATDWTPNWEPIPPTMSTSPSFCEICKCGGGKGAAFDYYIGMAILPAEEVVLRIFDNKTNQSIKDAKVEVYSGSAGFTMKLFEAETDREGVAKLNITPSEYGVRITAYRYHQLYATLDVTTTTTSTTTSSATTTSITETTMTLKHFMLETTTTLITTTTQEEPSIIGNAIQKPEEHEPQDKKETDYTPYTIILIIAALPAVAWLRRKRFI